MLKKVLKENGQKSKTKCFNCSQQGVVISKETVKSHGKDQDRSHQQDDVPLKRLSHLVYTALKRVVPRECVENLRIARIILSRKQENARTISRPQVSRVRKIKVVEEGECLLNKLKEILKKVLRANGKKGKSKLWPTRGSYFQRNCKAPRQRSKPVSLTRRRAAATPKFSALYYVDTSSYKRMRGKSENSEDHPKSKVVNIESEPIEKFPDTYTAAEKTEVIKVRSGCKKIRADSELSPFTKRRVIKHEKANAISSRLPNLEAEKKESISNFVCVSLYKQASK